ncbi:hypothetical protein MASR2M79_11160 [Aminivibrio sp.]
MKSWGLHHFSENSSEEGEFSLLRLPGEELLERNIGWRIDHILVTPALERAVDYHVDRSLRGVGEAVGPRPRGRLFDLKK